MDLIDDSEPVDFDSNLLKKEIERLRGGSPQKNRSPKKPKKINKNVEPLWILFYRIFL